jgi:hypothetical protein
MLSRRVAIGCASLIAHRAALAQWPAESYRVNPGRSDSKPPAPHSKSSRPLANPTPNAGGVVYAADAELESLNIVKQVVAVLGAGFRAESSPNITTSVEHLATRSPTSWAVLPALALDFLNNRGLTVAQSICYIAHVGAMSVHVVATSEIHRLSDLAGRKVNLGLRGSQNQITATMLLDRLAMRVEALYDDHERALVAVMRGQIAALVLLAMTPAALLFNANDVHLLPVTAPLAGCFITRLMPADYPLLLGGESGTGNPLETIGVPMILASYDWPRDTSGYVATAQMAELLVKQPVLDEMLRREVPGWRRFSAMDELLRRHAGR